ncbi:MAG TPA: N-acetyltransferase [Lactobacillus sp.]|nr:N-acetyltransferase [Lactobacillus sp.]
MTQISTLTQENAEIIANNWHYDGIYQFYDMKADPEDYQELISSRQRGDHYFQVTNEDVLIGFFAVETTTQPFVLEIGLGMKPDLTGQGNGRKFVQLVLKYVQTTYHSHKILFDVAEFNERARKLYSDLGFITEHRHLQATNGGKFSFVMMALTL